MSSDQAETSSPKPGSKTGSGQTDEPRRPAPSDEVVLSVQGLHKTYRVYTKPQDRLLQAIADRRHQGPKYCFEVPAVQGISFELTRGDAISIIGRNGSGKSTLLEMIAGTLDPSGGSVQCNGRVSALLELGAGFNPDFTGRQNFRMSAAIQGLSDKEIRDVEPAVEAFAEVGAFFDEPVRTYSSGMYVRVAFASAVHVQPDLLIVDEALAVGDIFFQQKCFAFMQNNLQNTSKLIVTHDLASAVRMSSRCLVMDQGSVVFDGEPLDAVETYTSLSLRDRSSRLGSSAAGDASTTPSEETAEPSDAEETKVARAAVAELTELPLDRSTNPDLFSIPKAGVAVLREDGWDLADSEAALVQPGEQLELRFEATISASVPEPVIGYIVRDRVGNPLFGQNSIGSEIPLRAVEPGKYFLTLNLTWPEVEEGDYVVTVGLGDGQHALHHDIVAWVQSVVAIRSLPARAVHGMFNNDLESISLAPLDDSSG